jgi:phosphate-selective porin OprO/OprP
MTAAWMTLGPAVATAQPAASATASGATASAPSAAPSDEASLRARIEVLAAELRSLERALGATAVDDPASAATVVGESATETRAAMSGPGTAAPSNEAIAEGLPQLDQKIRIIERKLELEQEKHVEAAKSAPVTGVGRDGFQIRSADGAYQLRFRGLIQADSRAYLDDTGAQGADTFVLRRVRPIFDGTVFKYFDFRLTPDFGSGTTVLQDAYVDMRFRPSLKLRAGKQKQPFGLERLASANNLAFIERALPTAVAGNRDLGAMLYGDLLKNRFSYWAGVFNGVPDGASSDVDERDGKDVVARVMVHPFRETGHRRLEGLGLGVAGSYGSQTGTLLAPGLATYRTSGQLLFFRYRADGTDAGTVLADGTRYRVSAQGYLYSGRFGVLGEQVFSSQEVRRATDSGRMGTNSWQVLGTWVLTGERASYTGVVPRYAFEPSAGKLGAFELTARYHQLTADRDAFPIFANSTAAARAARAWATGLNWYVNRSVKLSADYEQTHFDGGALDGDRPTEHDIFTRVQFGF